MLIRKGLHSLGIVLVLVLFGPATGCKYSTSKNPIVTTTGDGVGSGSGGSSGGSGGAIVGTIDANCMTGSYDACIFHQNPVSMRGSAFPAKVSRTTDLSAYQTYGVKITGTDGSGFLQNSSFQISPSTVQAVRMTGGSWKYPYSICSGGSCVQDGVHRISQLMAYYWLNFQAADMAARTGAFFASGKGIPVDPFSPGLENAYWDSMGEAIVLGEDPIGQDFAISAEVYLHENGHANVHYGSLGNIEDVSALEVVCAGGQAICCTTADGCPGAINEGLADYHAGVIFPADTALGGTIVNSTLGFDECGLPRRIDSNTGLSALVAYNACGGNARGEVHVSGRVYASVWWEVRKAAANKTQIDTLFTEHLRVITATDDFETLATKINTLDNMLFGGSHIAAFNAQWAGRGLAPK